jgi:ribonuclease PH
MRHDGRTPDELRPITITRHFTQTPAGSVLWQQGKTIIYCTASVTAEVPPWFKEDRAGGWLTCEYVMLPAATPQRKPWPKIGHTDGRGTEIQRLIGRSVRAAIDLNRIGPHTIAVDCQVLQADGGTRTAAISAAYVALADAVASLPASFDAPQYDPRHALREPLAAVSVGLVDGEIRLDLDYHDDSRADVDMNVAATASGKFVEVQASAENGGSCDRKQFDQLLDLALGGCRRIMEKQHLALHSS